MIEEAHEIFFHVGTGKTGSTFLQSRIFPKLKGIHYIPTNRYHKIFEEISQSTSKKLLISREFDRQMEREILHFSKKHPNSTPIIVFRRHDSYIASQYRRFVKNGFKDPFRLFFDLKHNKGFFKHHHLNYKKQVELLRANFDKEPLVFTYEDFSENPISFTKKWSQVLGCTLDENQINWQKKHRSYSEHQLQTIQTLSTKFNLTKRRVFKNNVLHLLWRMFYGGIRYGILYLSFLVPKRKGKLIPEDELTSIRKYYENDWEHIQSIAVPILPQAR